MNEPFTSESKSHKKIRWWLIVLIALPAIGIMFVVYWWFFPFKTSSDIPFGQTKFYASEQKIAACEAGGGSWKNFNSCAPQDNCDQIVLPPETPFACDLSVDADEGCDCGIFKCWDDQLAKCVDSE